MPLSPEKQKELDEALQSYIPGAGPSAAPGAPTDKGPDPNESEWRRAGRGALRGAASDISAFVPNRFMPSGLQEWIDKPDADWVETAGRYGGEFGPMLLFPELDFGLGAKGGAAAGRALSKWLVNGKGFDILSRIPGVGRQKAMDIVNALHGTGSVFPATVKPAAETIAGKVGGAATKGAIGGAALDPKDPVTGALTGAAGGLGGKALRAGGKAVAQKFPGAVRTAKDVGKLAAGFGLASGAGALMTGSRWPALHTGYAAGPAVAAGIAGLMGKPAAAGALSSVARQWAGRDRYAEPLLPRTGLKVTPQGKGEEFTPDDPAYAPSPEDDE